MSDQLTPWKKSISFLRLKSLFRRQIPRHNTTPLTSSSPPTPNTKQLPHQTTTMGGSNLEVFKVGSAICCQQHQLSFSSLECTATHHTTTPPPLRLTLKRYIMFPIAVMYYFGTNLDNRFHVGGFWPNENQTHKIPHERDEIKNELQRLQRKRLEKRAARMELEPLENKKG